MYTLILFISKNDRPDEPYIVLSQQILITYNSNPLLLTNYINNSIFRIFKSSFLSFNYRFKIYILNILNILENSRIELLLLTSHELIDKPFIIISLKCIFNSFEK